MARLFKWLIVLAALSAVIAFLPIGGRSVLQRWEAARSPGAFVSGSWREIERGTSRLLGSGVEPHPPAGERAARASRAPAARPTTHPATPVERHTEADRKALDQIVAEHVK